MIGGTDIAGNQYALRFQPIQSSPRLRTFDEKIALNVRALEFGYPLISRSEQFVQRLPVG